MPELDVVADDLRLRGERLLLRPIRVDDAGGPYLGWINDPEVNRYLEVRHQPATRASLEDYIRAVIADPRYVFLAIVIEDGKRHIGNIKLGPIDSIHRLGDIGIIIGDKSTWGRGYATEAIRLLVDFGFRERNLHKITASAYGGNVGSTRAFERAGFVEECRRLRHFACEGSWVDSVHLAIWNER